MAWSHLKVFWLSKDGSIGHSERKKKKRETEEELEDNVKEWTEMDLLA